MTFLAMAEDSVPCLTDCRHVNYSLIFTTRFLREKKLFLQHSLLFFVKMGQLRTKAGPMVTLV